MANVAALETGGELPDETVHMFDPAFAIDYDDFCSVELSSFQRFSAGRPKQRSQSWEFHVGPAC